MGIFLSYKNTYLYTVVELFILWINVFFIKPRSLPSPWLYLSQEIALPSFNVPISPK